VLEDRIQELPRQFNLGVPREQGWVSEKNVENESLVGLRAGLREALAVQEVHGYVADFHRAARDLRAEPQRDPLIGLNPKYQRIRA
jgi:hypothetical protein